MPSTVTNGVLFVCIVWIIIAVIVFSITYSVSNTHPREAEPLMWSTFISSLMCMLFISMIDTSDRTIWVTLYATFVVVFVFVITLLSVVFIGSMPSSWIGLIPASVASTFTLFGFLTKTMIKPFK